MRGEDHPRRAEAALQPVLRPERVLQRRELAVLRQSLDGGHARAVGLDRERGARLDGDAVHQHGAGAALAGITADLGAGQPGITEEVHEEEPRLDVPVVATTVDADADSGCHEGPPARSSESGRIPPWMRGPRKWIVTCRLSTRDTSLRHHPG